MQDVEKWLHDTPPTPGKLYKKIINDWYKNNLLIAYEMELKGPIDEMNKEISKEKDELKVSELL